LAAPLHHIRLWLLLPLLAGCAGVPARIESRSSPRTAQGIILVAGGAGGTQSAPRALAAAVDQHHLPLYVRSFDWTHGNGRWLADLRDVDFSRGQGRRLADLVRRHRATNPDVPVYLVGYSAGSAVVLAAADSLCPGSVERIVLLAPAVSSGYDLRQALLAARCGVDVFLSERDTFYLWFGTGLLGTADGRWDASAGRVGFRPPALRPGEEGLLGKLRQHPWGPCVEWTGHVGEHSGSLRPAYLETFVLPLLNPTP
jgi:hypothetical protein